MKDFTHSNYFCHERKPEFHDNRKLEVIPVNTINLQKNLKTEAIKLAEKGFSILPLYFPLNQGQCSCKNPSCTSSGKHPLTKNGVKDASNDRKIINDWWERFPQANIGIATGKSSNLCVLDIDLKNDGYNSLQTIEQNNGPLPESTRVNTGGGGLHIFFRAEGLIIKNKVNLWKGIDIGGDGGYVVAPPSTHASGNQYQWHSQGEIDLLPAWVAELLINGHQSPSSHKENFIGEGQRNQTLTSIAGFLRAKGLDNRQLESILKAANEVACCPILNDEEVLKIARSITKYPAELPWPQARSLPKVHFKVEALKDEFIPFPLRTWINDVAERMQVPLEFIAAPAVVAAGSVIGRKIGIRPMKLDDWTVVPNMWGFLVAEPGAMKSPAIAAALKPLEALQSEARKQFHKICQDSQKEERDLLREIASIKQALKVDLHSGFMNDFLTKRKLLGDLEEKQAEKKSIIEKRYKTNDPTVEKLALILQENPQGILLLRDELSGWLEALNKNGREGNREFYLEAWNGNSSFSIDRIGRGTTHIDALCLSIFGGIQPDKLEKYINKTMSSHGDDGFLERFQIVVYPRKPKAWTLIDRAANAEAEKAAFQVFRFLDQLKGPDCPLPVLNFSFEAQSLADEWRCNLERRLLEEDLSPIFKAHLSKYRSLMPGLALIFGLINNSPKNALPMSIDGSCVQMAILWCQLLESHIRRIYQRTFYDPLYGARTLAQKIKAGQVFDKDKLRDISRRNWRALKTAEQLEGAVDKLKDFGWARIEATQTIGGKSEIIRINPNLPEEVEI